MGEGWQDLGRGVKGGGPCGRPVAKVPPPASEGVTYNRPIPGGPWIDAGHLRPGDRLLNPDGTWAEVVSVEERAEPLDAWTLPVDVL